MSDKFGPWSRSGLSTRWLDRVSSTLKNLTPFRPAETTGATVRASDAEQVLPHDGQSSTDLEATAILGDEPGPEPGDLAGGALTGPEVDRWTRGVLIKKVAARLGLSVLIAFSVALIPVVVLLMLLDSVLEVGEAPTWFRETALTSVAGGALAIVLIVGVLRAGVRIKRKGDRYVIRLRRRL